MFKVIGLLKRKPGMSVEDFRTYYETRHRVIGEKYLKGHASRYMRRFLTPSAHPSAGEASDSPCDVILEIWYDNESIYEEAQKLLSTPEARAEIEADEAQLFDRSNMHFFFVEEHESDFGN